MVGHLIKSITSKDSIIISGITHIQGIVDQRNDFKSGADSLLLTAENNGNTPEKSITFLQLIRKRI